MNLILLLPDAEEAKLLAKAEADGTTPELLVRRAIQPILDSSAETSGAVPKDFVRRVGASGGGPIGRGHRRDAQRGVSRIGPLM